jgi:hypothetical protein
MLDQDFANKCIREFQEELSEDKTLREFLSSYMSNCGKYDEDIESTMSDEYTDLIDSWATDNDMDYTEMYSFIMKSLDEEVEYDTKIDMDYDKEPNKTGSSSKPHWNKEVRFEITVRVNDISFECDEAFRDYEV